VHDLRIIVCQERSGREIVLSNIWSTKQAFQGVRKLDLKDAESKACKSEVGMYGKNLHVGECESFIASKEKCV
jgi:hypothetical protein